MNHDFENKPDMLYSKCKICGYRYTLTHALSGRPEPPCFRIQLLQGPAPTKNVILTNLLPKKTCTCGSAMVGSNRHSTWCDIK